MDPKAFLIAPRIKSALRQNRRPYQEMLFNYRIAFDLAQSLAIPIRPEFPSMVAVHRDALGRYRARDAASTSTPSLATLPTELHQLICSHIDNTGDLVRFGMANRYLWVVAYDNLINRWMSLLGPWAGQNVVCVGGEIEKGDYPSGLFSQEEQESLNQETIDVDALMAWGIRSGEPPKEPEPLTLAHFGNPRRSSVPKDTCSLSHPIDELFQLSALLDKISEGIWDLARPGIAHGYEHFHKLGRHLAEDLAYRYCDLTDWGPENENNFVPNNWLEHLTIEDDAWDYVKSDLELSDEWFYPTDRTWIFRNITTKEFVRPEAIALKPEWIRGPHLDGRGFGEVVLARTSWSNRSLLVPGGIVPEAGFSDQPTEEEEQQETGEEQCDIAKGVWAGHRFDITTLDRHEQEVEDAKHTNVQWKDISDEMGAEIAQLWGARYAEGPRDGAIGKKEGAEQVANRSWERDGTVGPRVLGLMKIPSVKFWRAYRHEDVDEYIKRTDSYGLGMD
ncbi:hypothetical protein F4778DRAFT_753231 [Xylariomycetidae sp. FL2044]|nr:hypothetical protein F4778DRAFT_753231 [Xylariomycetidae sp. FL2044]